MGDVRLYPITTHADSYKSGTAENDPAKGRIRIRYNLAEYDGYKIYDSAAISELSSTELLRPGRNEVVFVDLLPLAMQYDGAAPIYYGRLKDIEGLKSNYNSWDAEQVELPVVNVDTDIILNYNGTGRTLVRIHLKLKENADPALYLESKGGEKMWAEGWGVSFGAFYYWRDEKDASNAENIGAFLPDDSLDTYLLGENDTVFPDDGAVHDGKHERYNLFGSDINGDGITGIRDVIYMHAIVTDRVAQSFRSTIEKLVRADADAKLGYFTKSATVVPGETYTYQISLQTSQKPLKNIVIYDYSETAIDRDSRVTEHFDTSQDEIDFPNIPEEQLYPDEETMLQKQQNYWKGYFIRIEKDLLQPSINAFNNDPVFAEIVAEKGPVVPTYYYYYSSTMFENRGDVLIEHTLGEPQPDDVDLENPSLFLTGPFTAGDLRYDPTDPNRGWYTEDEWISRFGNESWQMCRGIAIDMHHFVLSPYSYLTFRYQMLSPDHDVSLSNKPYDFYDETKHNHDGSEGGIPATYAFNDVKYLGTDVEDIESEEGRTKITTSAPVKVNLLSTKTLEVEKKFAEDNVMPDGMEDVSFTFHAQIRLPHDIEYTDYMRKRYTLWEKDGHGGWSQVDVIPHSTDDSGYFSIKANQKAVFLNVDSKSDFKVTEEPNPFWECTETSELYRSVNENDKELIFYRKGDAFYADAESTSQMLFRKDGDNYYDRNGHLITGAEREAIINEICSCDYELVKRINK